MKLLASIILLIFSILVIGVGFCLLLSSVFVEDYSVLPGVALTIAGSAIFIGALKMGEGA